MHKILIHFAVAAHEYANVVGQRFLAEDSIKSLEKLSKHYTSFYSPSFLLLKKYSPVGAVNISWRTHLGLVCIFKTRPLSVSTSVFPSLGQKQYSNTSPGFSRTHPLHIYISKHITRS